MENVHILVCTLISPETTTNCVRMNRHAQPVVFSRVHPLADSDPAERTPARTETPAAEALAWLEDPQPPPPPETLHQQIAREIADAIGWPVEKMRQAIAELNTYPGDSPNSAPSPAQQPTHEECEAENTEP